MCKVLSSENLNMHVLSLADTDDYGIVRIVVDQPEKAVEVFRENGYRASISPVIVVKFDNRPGSTTDLLDQLDEHNVNIEYCYAYSADPKTAYLIFKTNSPGAEEFIQYLGYETFSKEDFINK